MWRERIQKQQQQQQQGRPRYTENRCETVKWEKRVACIGNTKLLLKSVMSMKSENGPCTRMYEARIRLESKSKDRNISSGWKSEECERSRGCFGVRAVEIHLPENVMIPLKQSILVSNQVTAFTWNGVPFRWPKSIDPFTHIFSFYFFFILLNGIFVIHRSSLLALSLSKKYLLKRN